MQCAHSTRKQPCSGRTGFMLSLILTLHLASVRYYPDALLIHSLTLKKDSQKLLINALYFSVFFFFWSQHVAGRAEGLADRLFCLQGCTSITKLTACDNQKQFTLSLASLTPFQLCRAVCCTQFHRLPNDGTGRPLSARTCYSRALRLDYFCIH